MAGGEKKCFPLLVGNPFALSELKTADTDRDVLVDAGAHNGHTEGALQLLSGVLRSQGSGSGAVPAPMRLLIKTGGKVVTMDTDSKLCPTPATIQSIEGALSPGCVTVVGGTPKLTRAERPVYRRRQPSSSE